MTKVSLTELVAANTRQPGGTCTVATTRSVLDPELATELDTLIADPSVPCSAIARALESLGHRIKQDTLQRHRRGDCACG